MTDAPGLRQLAPDLWVASDELDVAGLPMGRLMSVVRLPRGELLLISPAPMRAALRDALDELGPVRYVIGPGNFHGYLDMQVWGDAYPGSELIGGPGLAKRRPQITLRRELIAEPDLRWADVLDQAEVRGHRFFTEIEFFHRPSRTLITGDVCLNMGGDIPLRVKLWSYGPRRKPYLGPTPPYKAGIADRDAFRATVDRILEWDFDRLVPGHGRVVETGAHSAFRDAFAWLGAGAPA